MRNREEYREELLRLRRHCHQFPELALKEEKTSAFIREYLENLGYTLTLVPPTGWIAELPALKEKTRTVVLRAEMDALPMQEQTFLSGDNAYRYFQKTRGLFVVFLAAVPGQEYPLHHPRFVLNEEILPYSLEALYKILYKIGER